MYQSTWGFYFNIAHSVIGLGFSGLLFSEKKLNQPESQQKAARNPKEWIRIVTIELFTEVEKEKMGRKRVGENNIAIKTEGQKEEAVAGDLGPKFHSPLEPTVMEQRQHIHRLSACLFPEAPSRN